MHILNNLTQEQHQQGTCVSNCFFHFQITNPIAFQPPRGSGQQISSSISLSRQRM